MSPSRDRWIALAVLCMGSLMIVLDSTIVNVALPSIRSDLHFSQTSLAWVVNGYMLSFGGFLLLGGRLGDLYGPRRLFVAGIVLFSLASLTCGLAGSQMHARGRPRRAGLRRRGRLGRLAVADDGAVHRAGRPRQGDGRVRLRRRRRRQPRRAARRGAHRRARAGTGSSSSTCPSAPPCAWWRCGCSPPTGRERGAARLDVAGAVTVTTRADVRRLRDRQRQPGRLDLGPDARPARRRGRCC